MDVFECVDICNTTFSIDIHDESRYVVKQCTIFLLYIDDISLSIIKAELYMTCVR